MDVPDTESGQDANFAALQWKAASDLVTFDLGSRNHGTEADNVI